MNELIKIKENSYYLNSYVKVGLYVSDAGPILIDSGTDKENGNKILKTLEKSGLTPRAIINTHSHADHIGGNKVMQDKLGIDCYIAEGEKPYLDSPLLEVDGFFGAASPKLFQNKTFVAQKSNVKKLQDFVLTGDLNFEIFAGHSPATCLITTKDGVCYASDLLFSKETLDKYKISYLYDLGLYLNSLERLKSLNSEYYVLAHVGLVSDGEFKALIDINLAHSHNFIEKIKRALRTPSSFDDLVKKIFDDLNLTLNESQYLLSGSTIKSYLAYLSDRGEVKIAIKDNMLYWYLLE